MSKNNNTTFNSGAIDDTKITELIGICRGVLADGLINNDEASFLLTWLEQNRSCIDIWPANVLYKRLSEFLKDDVIDAAEHKELLIAISEITGGALPNEPDKRSHATTFDMDYPDTMPMDGKLFCLTGNFYIGPRKKIIDTLEAMGGTFKKTISAKLDYLIVGEVGSAAWAQSSFGRKIESAMVYRSKEYSSIQVIPERHWVAKMQAALATYNQ
tara:strand:+ start:179 stop:820 length:642 start_codon:yes stop_codon:yes gene_type:complete